MDKHERKDFRMEIKDVDQGSGTFTGYLSTFGNVDAQGDVVERGAFAQTLNRWRQKNKPIPLLWQHSEVIGGLDARDATEDTHGLFVKGQLILDLQRARETFALLKAGVVNAMSIGYDVIQQARENGIRKLKELRLYEGSLVLWPANESAEVLAVKNIVPFQDLPLADEGQGWDASKSRARVRKWATGEDDTVDWTRYRRAFLWVDPEAAESVAGYRLPIADVLDDTLKAVPRAIFAAAGVIEGGRAIPSADVPKLKNHLARYYSKLERTPPWEAASEAARLAEETQALYWLAQHVAFAATSLGKARTSEVQSVIFPKKHWSSADACRTWLKNHDFRSDKLDETEQSYRFRQTDPGKYDSMRTVCLTPAGTKPGPDCKVEAVLGIVNKSVEPTMESVSTSTTFVEGGERYVYDTVEWPSGATTLAPDGTNGTEVDPTKARALSAETKATLRQAVTALEALLTEADATDGVSSDSAEAATQSTTSEPGDSPSDVSELRELAGQMRELADTMQRRQ